MQGGEHRRVKDGHGKVRGQDQRSGSRYHVANMETKQFLFADFINVVADLLIEEETMIIII